MIITDVEIKTATNNEETIWDDFSSFHYVTSKKYIVEAYVTIGGARRPRCFSPWMNCAK